MIVHKFVLIFWLVTFANGNLNTTMSKMDFDLMDSCEVAGKSIQKAYNEKSNPDYYDEIKYICVEVFDKNISNVVGDL